MRALAALLLAPSICLANWTFEPYSDAHGMLGFRVLHDGIEQYDRAPAYQAPQVIGYMPLEINDNGWLVGSAYAVDLPDYSNTMGWDEMTYVLDPTGKETMPLQSGAPHWIGGDTACVQLGQRMRPYLVDIETGVLSDTESCVEGPQAAVAPVMTESAASEPGVLLLTSALWGIAFLLRAAADVTRRTRSSAAR